MERPAVEQPLSIAVVCHPSVGGSGVVATGLGIAGEVGDYLVQIVGTPVVEELMVNEGEIQRSKLTQLVVEFNGEVNAPASAFSLTNRSTNESVSSLLVNSTVIGGRTMATLQFAPGVSVITADSGLNSLADGNYQLDIDGSLITPVGGD